MVWPSWSEVALTIGGLWAGIRWLVEHRTAKSATAKKVESLETKLQTAELEIERTKNAATEAMAEKNRELDLIREDRDRITADRNQWMERAQHLESLVYSRGSNR